MVERKWPVVVYIVNLTLFLAHEIDGAYWHEWELFSIPGGIQMFLVVNVVAVAIVLIGLERLVSGKRSGHYFALLLGVSGLAIVGIHGYFLAAGDPSFRVPASIAVLVALVPVSLAQLIVTTRALRTNIAGVRS